MKKLILGLILFACVAALQPVQAQSPTFLGFAGMRSENGGVRGVFGLGAQIAGTDKAKLMTLARFDVGVNGQAFGEFGYAFKPIGGFLKHVTFMPLAGGGLIIDGEVDPIYFIGTSVGLVIALGLDENTAAWVGVRNAVPVEADADKKPASFGAGLSFGI